METTVLFSVLIFTTFFFFSASGQNHGPDAAPHFPPHDQDSSYDYSQGFPKDFLQGLPTFDFSSPINEPRDKEKGTQDSSDTQNVGFVDGPPKGFPSFHDLGGDFPPFGESNQGPPPPPPSTPHRESSFTHHQIHPHPNIYSQQVKSRPPSQSPSPHYEEEEDYLSGPGPSSVHNPIPSHQRHHLPPQIQHIQQAASVRKRPIQHPYHHSHPHANGGGRVDRHSYGQKRPLVLKVSSIKNGPTRIPEAPPVFYAPSPDVQRHRESHRHSKEISSEQIRFKRSLKVVEAKKDETRQEDKEELKAEGSEDTFWELEPPYVLIDPYHHHHAHSTVEKEDDEGYSGRSATDDGNGNVSILDPERGEQRFFPSFPAPSPFLGAAFGPPQRPPIFPGPSVTGSRGTPTRYHPQFGASRPLAPSRGPTNIYSAESGGERYQDNNLLGSGNFEVVRGGTYYEDDDNGYHGYNHDIDEGDYYGHNGHSSPNGYRLHNNGADFFSNFRDFADINPHSRSFSHSSQVTLPHPRGPKNIREKLESSDSVPVPQSALLSQEIDPMMATF